MSEHPNTKLQIAVCDDEAADCRLTADLTREILSAEGISYTISGYTNAAALLEAVQKGARFHILLLDVMMDGLDGLSLAAALRALGDSTAIIFTSSNRELALRGYEVSAARYLAKPLQTDQLREALLYCYQTACAGREIFISTEKGQSRLAPADILYVESWERGSRLQLTSGPIVTSERLSEMAERLPQRSFTFCHRTVLVNLAYVRHLRPREIELSDGSTLPVSKYRAAELKKRLLAYLGG